MSNVFLSSVSRQYRAVTRLLLLLALLVVQSTRSHAQTVTTYAGSGAAGFANGAAATARFDTPVGVCADAAGNIYVGDQGNHRIRKIDGSGNVTTLAGSGVQGFADGPPATARFFNPLGVYADAAGNIFVAGYNDSRIRKVDAGGNVTTYAGSGINGFADGPAATAQFNNNTGVCGDAVGNIYVADGFNVRIRKIDVGGNVTTYAGDGTFGFADGPAALAQFQNPFGGLCVDAAGNVYVADNWNNRIRKIDVVGNVTTYAGNGIAGFADGSATSAQFDSPYGVAADAAGNIYVADYNNNRIRKIDAGGNVTTLAGTATAGFTNGAATTAQFNGPWGVCADAAGNIYVADGNNHCIRKISPSAPVITSFSPANGSPGSTVVLTGSNFTGATALSFGGIPAASFTVNSATQITAVIGGSATVTGGTQLVIVSAPGGSSSRGGFFIGSLGAGASTASSGISGTPTGTIVSRIEPSAFTFGTSVIVRGAGFSGTTGLMLGGSAVTNFVVLNDNTISCVVGAVPTSDQIVISGSTLNTSVTTFGGIGASYFRQPAPSIVSLNPASVVASDDDVPLTLTGSNLNQGAVASSQALGVSSSLSVPVQTFSGAARAVLTFPGAARAVGIKTITLTNPDGQFASVTLAVTPAPAPILTSDAVITTTATGRAFTVNLAGTGFFKGARVFAGGQPLANVRWVSAARILAEIPAEVNQVDASQVASNQGTANQSSRTVRLQIVNTDGQSTTATLQIIRRPLPYIAQVLTTRVFEGNAAMWELRIRGGNFMGGVVAQLASEMLRVRSQAADTLIVARTLGDFRCTTTTASLIVTNPDGAAHGILLAQQLFDPLKSSASLTDASAPGVVYEAYNDESVNAARPIRIAPNPLTETLQLESPMEAPELVRLVNMLGVVVLESRERTVDVRSLPSGVYAVEITFPAGKRSVLRVVKQ